MADPDNQKLQEHPPSTIARQTSRRPSRRAKVVLPLGVAAAAGAAMIIPMDGATAVVADDVAPQVSPLITASERSAVAARGSRSSERGDAPLIDPITLAQDNADAPAADSTADPAAADAPKDGKKKADTSDDSDTGKTMSAKVVKKPAAARPADVAGARFTTAPLNVRTSPDSDANVVTTLDPREKVTITEANKGQWQQIVWNGKARWVKEDYLASKKPAADSGGGASSGGGVSGSDCSNGTSVLGGTGPNGHKVHRAVCANFPSINVYGGNRGGGGNHGTGRAIDIMVSGSLGWEVAQWVRAHAGELNVSEVIYSQKIWTVQRSGDGWRPMSNRGSATANHYDHVHVSTY